MIKSFKLLYRSWQPLKISVRNRPYPVSFTQFLQNNVDTTQYSKLQNGLTIATEERPGTPNACIGIYIDAGSRYESPHENGIAHFFEHMAFKGTKNRERATLEAEMAAIGATFRAFTTREMVCYYVMCLTEHVPIALDLLSDCVFNNALSKCEIECQKRVVYAEMLEHDKDTNKLLYDFLHNAAFQGTPLERTTMGPSSNLYNFNIDTLFGYLNRCFSPSRTVLAAVGSIKHEQILSLANCYLNNIEPCKAVDYDVYRYTSSEIRYRDDSMPAGNVVMAFEGPCFCEDDNIVMQIARYAVGGWDRSQISGPNLPNRLARFASPAPQCDSYKCFNINYKDTGLWGVQFLSDVHSLDDMSNSIFDDLMYLCTIITEEEVARAKRFFKAKYLSVMQSSAKNCHDVGRWTLYNGHRPSLLETITAIDRVRAKDVHEVCSRYIYSKCPTVAAIGRIEGLMEYSRFCSGTYWLRM
ncbi:unnamed protein product [Arctia plantaginis]|uniref:Mitochondrial processing peptidase n=1 Tax=Arctia plantaginis TaxID=874455 RepID=A0A8S0Z1I7_ARCPL|nr:unnamed protein product [Arctia plantaginis]